MQMPDIETPRLIIRATREEDGAACLDIWLDEVMGRYMADPPRDKADADTLNFAVGIEEQDDWYPMVVFHKESGDFLGTCSVDPMDGGARWDFGYAVHSKYQRQGYGTEILSALIERGKESGASTFSANVAAENEPSCGLLEKLGFCIADDTGMFRKRGTDIVYSKRKYVLEVFN